MIDMVTRPTTWLCAALASLLVGLAGCTTSSEPDHRPRFAVPRRGDRPKYSAGIEMEEGSGLKWSGDIEASAERARKVRKRVLVAFEGVTDVNGRVNRKQHFNQPAVRKLLSRYELVSLHIDAVPGEFYERAPNNDDMGSDAEANLKFETEILQTVASPLYVVLDPVGENRVCIVGVFDVGLFRDTGLFVEFLRDPAKRPE